MMSRFSPAFLLCASLTLASSCSGLLSKIVSEPKIEKKTLQVDSLDFQKVAMNLILEVKNPNGMDLPLESLQADIKVHDKPFLSKTWDTLPVLKGKKTTAVTLPFSLEWSELMKVGSNLLKEKELPYQLEGVLKVKGLSLPFKQDGILRLNGETEKR